MELACLLMSFTILKPHEAFFAQFQTLSLSSRCNESVFIVLEAFLYLQHVSYRPHVSPKREALLDLPVFFFL